MDTYGLGKVARTAGGRGEPFHAFNIIGVHGSPLVSFSFDTQEEAEAAHKAMQSIVATAKIITPFALSR
jgi:hypothetical protein